MSGLQIVIGADVNGAVNGITKVNQALSKLPTASNQATFALTNIGRVAQDLPYGFLGIANNLNPLLESFQRLKAETGSTGSALTALKNSLTGAGGVGLALSVVSSLLIVFGDRLFGSKQRAEENKKALDDLSTSIENVKNNVENLTSALQFQNQLGSINANIRSFGQLTGGELQDLREQSVAQRQLTADLLDQEAAARANLNTAIALNHEKNNDKTREAVKKAEDELVSIQGKIIQSRQTQTLIYRQIALQRLKDQQEIDKKIKEAADKALKEEQERLRELKKLHQQFREDLGKLLSEKITSPKLTGAQIRELFPTSGLPGGTKPLTVPIKFAFDQIDPVKDFKLQQVGQQLQDIFNGFGENIITAFGEGIGSAISGQEDAFGSILQAISALLKQVGEALVKYGAIKTGLDKIVGPGGFLIPGSAAIALGVAAIAASQLVKSTKIPGRAAGGPVTAGQPYIVGERGHELFIPSTSGRILPHSQMGGLAGSALQTIEITGKFVQEGTSLVAVVERTQRQNGRLR